MWIGAMEFAQLLYTLVSAWLCCGVVVESFSPPSFQIATRASTFLLPSRAIYPACTKQCGRSTGFASLTSISALENAVENSESDGEDFIEIESLSANQILELIELSFLQACFALSKGDVGPLGLFVVAVKTASKKYPGASALAISECVDALPPSARPLEENERKLREVWIRAVYLLLGKVMEDFSGGAPEVEDEVVDKYGPVLMDLVAVHQTGMGLNAKQFVNTRQDLLLTKNTNILALEEEEDDQMELAVVTQTINVLYTTLVVLEDEQNDDPPTSSEKDSNENTFGRGNPAKKKKKKGKSSSNGRGFG